MNKYLSAVSGGSQPLPRSIEVGLLASSGWPLRRRLHLVFPEPRYLASRGGQDPEGLLDQALAAASSTAAARALDVLVTVPDRGGLELALTLAALGPPTVGQVRLLLGEAAAVGAAGALPADARDVDVILFQGPRTPELLDHWAVRSDILVASSLREGLGLLRSSDRPVIVFLWDFGNRGHRATAPGPAEIIRFSDGLSKRPLL